MAVKTNKINLSVDLRWVCVLLAAMVVGMLLAWKPWVSDVSSSTRTIEVSGTATVKAEPDDFIFYPTYTIEGKDKETKFSNLKAKSAEVVDGLKKLGVSESKIKTSASSYVDYYKYYANTDADFDTLTVTIQVSAKDMAQKVQDFLLTTKPSGQLTPQTTFSDDKRKELESQARDEATKDARSRAEQMAKNLGAKLGKVKSVNDSSSGGVMPMYDTMGVAMSSSEGSVKSSLSVLPGEDQISLSVSVVYYIN